MSVITTQQATQYAQQAGFSGSALDTIVAIAVCESGLNTNARNTAGNSPPSMDRGLVQINNYWHKEISDTCAFDPGCAMQQAYRISNGGTNFNQWTTYRNGCYKNHLGNTGSNPAQPTPQTSPDVATSLTTMIGSLLEEAGLFLLALVAIALGIYLLAGEKVSTTIKGITK
jgi:hypothetical protein